LISSGASVVYKSQGFLNPGTKMLVVRLLHAVLSLLVVSCGYKIASRYGGEKSAKQVGLLLALFWFMPFLAVRNLVEIVAIPFLMLGTWTIMNAENRKNSNLWIFIGGVILGLAFSVRFQTLLFIGGTGLALLILQKWREAIFMGIGALLSIVIIQGGIDLIIWGRPFAELTEYIVYNIIAKGAYGFNNYMMYPEIILGVLIPPISFFMVFGFFRTWKKYLIVFLPVMVFFLFHEYFPNKQERFIFTLLPFFVVTGIVGWNEFTEKSKFWQKHVKFISGSFIVFWILNFALLLFATTSSSKISKPSAMLYLHPYRGNIEAIVLDYNNRPETVFLPLSYLGKWVQVYQDVKDETIPDSLQYIHVTRYQKRVRSLESLKLMPDAKYPQYVLFYGEDNLDERVAKMQNYYPDLTFDKRIDQSILDDLLYSANPKFNQNMDFYIYRTQKEPFSKL
jgi:hypothetical protein